MENEKAPIIRGLTVVVDAKGGSSNQFREDVLRLYELSEYIRLQESSVARLKSGSNGPISAAG